MVDVILVLCRSLNEMSAADESSRARLYSTCTATGRWSSQLVGQAYILHKFLFPTMFRVSLGNVSRLFRKMFRSR